MFKSSAKNRSCVHQSDNSDGLHSHRAKAEQVGSSSVDYLVYSGFAMMAYFWALQASKATELLASGKGKESDDFYTAKIQTAEFYFARLLPRADGHYSAALAPTSAVMQMPQELFQMT